MITGMPRIAIAVNDFPKAIDFFKEKLGMPVVDMSAGSVDSLGAKLAMCVPENGSNIELMSPADPDAPLSQSLDRFLDRRGEGLFALMLEAPDPNAEAEDLLQRGLNVLPLMAGAGGRDIHPNSTHGVLIRVYPVNSFQGSNQESLSDADSPGISGIDRVIIAVEDIDHAVAVYGDKLAMDISTAQVDSERGVKSALCSPPSGGQIELVAVIDQTRPFAQSIAEFLEGGREGMYTLVLKSARPEALASRELDVRASSDSSEIQEIHTDFGVLLRIEQD